MVTVNNECFLFRKLSIDFRHSRFSFFAIENIQNLETTKNFQKLIFEVLSLFIWFSSTFLSILCVQDKNSQGVAQCYQRTLIKLSRSHFLLHFPLFQSTRQSLLTNINKIDESILKKHDELITKTTSAWRQQIWLVL